MTTDWATKLNSKKKFQIKIIEKKFADIPAGSKMLIATPLIVDQYILNIPFGESSSLSKMRQDLAKKYQADKTCPVSTGIYLRIVAEAAYQEFENGESNITPFWRVIDKKSKIITKLSCGLNFIIQKRKEENIDEEN